MLAHECTRHFQCGVYRNATELIEGAPPRGGTQNFASEMPAVTGDSIRLARRIGLDDDRLFAAELRACADALVETLTPSSAASSLVILSACSAPRERLIGTPPSTTMSTPAAAMARAAFMLIA
jgi:hypothetical protein